jgi:hypothetical protein
MNRSLWRATAGFAAQPIRPHSRDSRCREELVMNASALRRGAARRLAIAALGLGSLGAAADPGHSVIAYSTGSFVPTDPTGQVNTGFGTVSLLPDGSSISHMGCIAAIPGGVGCSVAGPIVVDTWYKRASLPTLAAAQAFADYGVLKARSWRTAGPQGYGMPGDPLGSRSFYGEATAEWMEDLIYTGTTPTAVTMQFSLHAKWNDRGRFAFTFGLESFGAENVRLINGLSYVNCAGALECENIGGAQTVQVLGNDADNTSGDVTLAINYTFLLIPDNDPERPGPMPPFTFVANLNTWGQVDGAETDAFNTVTLERILVQPGAQIGFASGHDWPVQVVPEPATGLLWLCGLAALPWLRRLARPAPPAA